MIKFFRKIRQRLLVENRLGRYFLYAIGEIVLVVIGILIAIKINAYNNAVEDQKILANQLENVTLELEGNLALIENTISQSNAVIEAARLLAEKISTQDQMPPTELSQLLGSTFAPVLNYQANTGILNEMIVTGNLRSLENEELRQMLLDFESRLARIENQESLHAGDQESCAEFILKYGDFKAIMDDTGVSDKLLEVSSSKERKGNQVLLNAKEFENKLLLFIASGIGLRDEDYVPFKEYLEQILVKLETDLNSIVK